MKFAITGGGTGGHLAIAKALAEAIQKSGEEAIYIGSTLGQDRAWFESSSLFTQCYFLDSVGVVNKRGLGKLKALFKQAQCVARSRKILKSHKIECVISVGGFSAGGASIASLLCAIPLFIHEQNAIKGKLNEILTPFAKAVFGSFESDSKNFIRTSYPVRDEFFTKARVRESVREILFLGGSQGAKGINDFALTLVPELLQRGIKVAHQCGERDFERMKEAYEKLGIVNDIDVFAFDTKLVERLWAADLCIGRSGASSLWEMSANGLIGIFVPYPYAAKDHQYFNALYFAKEDLGEVIRESELSAQAVLKFIESLQGEKLTQKSQQVMSKIKPYGAQEILKHIQRICGDKG
ncbi:MULTISPECIES: undecaprenyldiphospho-muramoylpentapeptide beta-N-acetylglucosaminyltransferase [Helicobacter]|uniref:UDP-N-acetylglucosamine--N-acetylmuramyl-(pentapeptide) pyrophosphoryl-undecaprenol N-acetylglucosamine transferase n=1 Tax=Helicobacter typhlonius TaxID=76936 RepID=A0A099UI08_9HELI|nr:MULTISPECIES: undecaprenyldiphospho-muramoylpentapeptide beta-N-acetylglucosaminyltransferase [Helicobacter]TLD78385.1 undecaprenyldiphospho-muramoylpentapeptide beta-N-acetylglucosaminyltransferase [Helicobacter typhlonius]TLD87066.1 undecaprenyldiphospho-muramoylpentapeptide beta-N-acetylglucosaminyltransferase [Helicobacter sp. MIT 03-1616]CUU39130.1 UDP-N-acetylglucosamine--N-acetylmuramyl-(pentapeptide) pyrophosphoryl-undecaprenol N-acetylglucosamine transferase [Helicobacter typhlonius]